MTDFRKLPEDVKDDIIAQAILLCRWRGWLESTNGFRNDPRALGVFDALKDKIEKATGQGIMTYT